MNSKILIAEDVDATGLGMETMLKQKMGFKDVTYTQHCNEAYLKIAKADMEGSPFTLLITDLSFKQEGIATSINSGYALIKKIRKNKLSPSIIIFSIEQPSSKIYGFLKEYQINGYVPKGINGLKELQTAVKKVLNGKKYFSPNLGNKSNNYSTNEISVYDRELLQSLALGLDQTEIAERLKREGKSPCSKSSVEKRISQIKDVLRAKTTIQAVAIAKDLGII